LAVLCRSNTTTCQKAPKSIFSTKGITQILPRTIHRSRTSNDRTCSTRTLMSGIRQLQKCLRRISIQNGKDPQSGSKVLCQGQIM
jgi:hypothetical protein